MISKQIQRTELLTVRTSYQRHSISVNGNSTFAIAVLSYPISVSFSFPLPIFNTATNFFHLQNVFKFWPPLTSPMAIAWSKTTSLLPWIIVNSLFPCHVPQHDILQYVDPVKTRVGSWYYFTINPAVLAPLSQTMCSLFLQCYISYSTARPSSHSDRAPLISLLCLNYQKAGFLNISITDQIFGLDNSLS